MRRLHIDFENRSQRIGRVIGPRFGYDSLVVTVHLGKYMFSGGMAGCQGYRGLHNLHTIPTTEQILS